MNEPNAPSPLPGEPSPSPPERVQIASDPAKRRSFAPLVYVVGLVVLGVALAFLWRLPGAQRQTAAESGRIDTLEQQVRDLSDRVSGDESKPAPAAAIVDLGPLEARLTRLEQRPVPAPQPDSAASDALAARLDALATRLDARLTEQAAATAATAGRLDATVKDVNDLNGRAAATAATAGRLDAAIKDVNDLSGKIGSFETRLTALEAEQSQVAELANRAQRLSRLQVASIALDQGQKLGDVPGAPPALARFAATPPPTEASLRLTFPGAAEAAHRMSQPAITDNQGFFGRAWVRAQQSVTVRQGDRVVLGDPVAGVLAHAQELLDAGDIEGCVRVLQQLAGPAKAAMASWTDQAQSLLDARAALASLAAKG